jgi:molybdopterin synthase sulfur carrier subunit
MAIIVRIPTPLRTLTGGKSEVDAAGTNILEIINDLEKTYPGIKERICEKNDQVRRFVNVYLNDEDIRFIDNNDSKVEDGDTISIIPAIAGGTSEKKKFYLNYPQEVIKDPLIYLIGKNYNIITNIRSASISNDIGIIALEVEGEQTDIEKAIKFLESKGVSVEPIVLDIIE